MKTHDTSAIHTCIATLLLLAPLCGCQPEYPACHRDETCRRDGRDEYCVNARCAQCRDDSHCVAQLDRSHVCEQGACVRTVGYCDPPEFPCPAGIRCRDNRCGCECLEDSVCPEAHTCENCRCVPEPYCVTDADCPPGMVCRDKECLTPACEPRPIYFSFDESAVRADARATLEANVECWRWHRDAQHREYTIELTGHHDERASADFALQLGQRRADAVADALVELGVPRERITTRSAGSAEPAAPNATTEAEHQRNQRVELRFLD